MTSSSSDEDDQLARFGKELREGKWRENSRKRAQRRKSKWNLLLPLFHLPLWALFALLLIGGASSLHRAIFAGASPLFTSGPLSANAALVAFPAVIAALCPAFIVTNFLVYLIPPARKAMELEDRGHSGVDYASSQRALSRGGLWIGVVCVPLMLLGVLLA